MEDHRLLFGIAAEGEKPSACRSFRCESCSNMLREKHVESNVATFVR